MPGEIQQRPSADSLAGNGQPAPLVIGQPDPVLFPKDVDRSDVRPEVTASESIGRVVNCDARVVDRVAGPYGMDLWPGTAVNDLRK